MNPADEFFCKLSNLWFYKEPPENVLSNGLKNFFTQVVKGLEYGEDAVYSHPKIAEIIQLCKDFGIFEYNKNIMRIYYEGKMRAQIELREMFNSDAVAVELKSLMNVLGDMFKEIEKEAKDKIEEEKNRSAIPSLTNRHTFKN